LRITGNLELVGRGVTIDAQRKSRVLEVTEGVTATIRDLTITGGLPKFGDGGGIRNLGVLSVINSTISGNDVLKSYIGDRNDDGGGIYNSGTLSVINSTISENGATWCDNGGGIYNSGTLSVVDSTISDNTTLVDGGGVYNSGELSVVNSTISSNSAGWSGGGIYNGGSTLSVVNATIVKNTADANNDGDGGGGGIRTDHHFSSATTLHNTIVADNSVGNGLDNDLVGAVESESSCNLIGDGGAGGLQHGVGGNQVGVDPLLDPAGLRYHGGLTQTIALLPGSPAIDKGNNAEAADDVAGLTTDQRDVPFVRIYDGLVDVGAYEVQPLVVVDTTEDESDGNFASGDLSLREAIELTNASVGAETIMFARDLAGKTITLTSGELPITDGLTISGPGADQLTISGDQKSRIFNVYNTESIIEVTIRGLSLVDGRAGSGGGINNHEDLTVEGCTLSGNSAEDWGGGGIYNSSLGTLTVTGSTLANNWADDVGGSIGNSGTLTVTNSTLANSESSSGGGIFNNSGATLTVTGSTLANNSASAGGGISNYGTLTLANSLFGGNTASLGPDVRNAGTIDSAQYNLIQDGAGSGIDDGVDGNQVDVPDVGLDPGGLQDHGGPTQTIALRPDSPAIDAGDNSLAVDSNDDALEFDQRGDLFVRIYDTAVDVGAYEVQPLVVDTTEDESDGDFSPGDLSLREAIELANAFFGADTIDFASELAGGTITLTSGELSITDDLTIEGLGADQLTISGNDESRIFQVDDTDDRATINVQISGLSLDDGHAYDGGGIYNREILTIEDCTLYSNSAFGRVGGGIYNSITGTLTVTNSTLDDNSASLYGGGIYNDGTLWVENSSTIKLNRAERSGGTLTVTNSTLSGNSASNVRVGAGGGIYSYGTLTVTNSTLSGNSSRLGGGICNRSTLTVINSTLSGNSSHASGGGIYSDGTLTVANSTLFGNWATFAGGGIYVSQSLGRIVNSTIFGNWTTAVGGEEGSDGGGGIYNGGIYGPTSTLNIANSLVGGNMSPYSYGLDILNEGTIAAQHNVIQQRAGSGINDGVNGNQVGVDPLLDPAGLQDHGGPTQTIALLPGSPAINAGNSQLAVDLAGDPLEFDQRGSGYPRMLHGTVDAGSFELRNQPPVVGNRSATVTEGGTLVLTGSHLSATDPDTDHATLVFTLKSLPANGQLKKDGTALAVNSTFTQADITSGKIAYTHDHSNTTNDSLTFTVEDSLGNETGVETFAVTVTAVDDDPQTLTIDSPTVTEGTGGTTTLTFTVTAPLAVQDGFKVAFAAADGTAGASDYSVTTAMPLTFAGTAGETQTISVDITTDAIVEDNEQFTITLGDVTDTTPVQDAAITTRAVGTGTIDNDDTATFTINDQTVDEDAGTMTLTVSLDNPVDTTVVVDVTYTDVTATGSGTDYDSAPDQVTFAAGDATDKTVTVAIADDSTAEGTETFTASLSTSTGLGGRPVDLSDTGTGTISDDLDADGVEDGVEALAGGGSGDGNQDGIPDSEQPHVTSLPNAADGQYVTIVTLEGSQPRDVRSVEAPPLPEELADIDPMLGCLDFEVHQLAPDGTATVELIVPNVDAPNTLYKFGPTADDPVPHWYEFQWNGTVGAERVGEVIVVHYKDGELGDNDLTVDGKIVDPVVPAFDALPYHNRPNPCDVNHDTRVSVLDVLPLINDITRNGIRTLDPHSLIFRDPDFYVDTNGDRAISTMDILVVVWFLNQQQAAEGESLRQQPALLAASPMEPLAVGVAAPSMESLPLNAMSRDESVPLALATRNDSRSDRSNNPRSQRDVHDRAVMSFLRESTRHFKTGFREGEAPAEPCFLALSARREPRPPGFETASSMVRAKTPPARVAALPSARAERNPIGDHEATDSLFAQEPGEWLPTITDWRIFRL